MSMISDAPRRPTRLTSAGRHALLVGAACLLPAGCARLFDLDEPLPDRAGPARLRAIEPIDFTRVPQRPSIPANPVAAPAGTPDTSDPPAARSAPARMELALADVRALALSNNLDLRVALVSPEIARAALDEESARFEAVFGASARWSRSDFPVALGTEGSRNDSRTLDTRLTVPLRTGGSFSLVLPVSRSGTNNPFSLLDPAYRASLRAIAAQPLLRGGGVATATAGIRIARREEAITSARTRLEILRVLAAADRSYWALFGAQQRSEIALRQYELAAAQLERARRRVAAGDAPEIEVLRAETGLATRTEAIIVAENDRRRRQRELKRLMNMPGVGLDTATDLLLHSVPDPMDLDPDPAALVALAEAGRMELLEIELQLAVDRIRQELARNQRLPLLDLEASYGLSGLGGALEDAFDPIPRSQFDDWSVGLRAEIPIGGNEAGRARERSVALSRLQRLATRDARRQLIEQEIHDAIDRLRESWQRILAAGEERTLAARTLDAERRQFDVGLRTSTDVLDAAARLAEAEGRETNALVEHEIAQIDLALATGTLLGRSRVTWEPAVPPDHP
ncbi:MAG: TolC family protein [Phycisphaeraceae bacterium]|nr:TolC family protein [Phycisphaeraceae bacterium]